MPKKSKKDAAPEQLNRKSMQPVQSDLARLRRAMKKGDEQVDCGLPSASRRAYRDSSGRLPRKTVSPIREAVLNELGRRDITRYQLWKIARQHCRTLPESAVYEFLRGQRAISVDYCEALLKALDLGVRPLRTSA